MVIEALGPFIPLLIPLQSWWRALPVCCLMSLHAGIFAMMNLWHFSLLAMAINVIFLPTPFWDMVASLKAKVDLDADYQKPKTRNLCWPCSMPILREAVVAAALSYVILHMEVFQSHYRNTPLDDHNVLYQVSTLDELWIMYSGVSTQLTYWDIHVDIPETEAKVDVLQWLRTGTWEASSKDVVQGLPSCFSCLYPNVRWEMFLSKIADAPSHLRMLRMRAMTRWLCARGRNGHGLSQGSQINFTNRLVYVNPPASEEHFRDGGIQIDQTFTCEAK